MNKLAAWMQRNGKTAEDVGVILGVDAVTVRRYMNGDRRPRWAMFPAIREMTNNEVGASDFEPDARPQMPQPTPHEFAA
jgi:transcriptional regulator with XRE-family HTH domain